MKELTINEINKSIKSLLQNAESDAVSQFYVYIIYKEYPLIIDEAIKYLLKSAENGYAKAQLELGYRYKQGNGIEENQQKASEWFKKAAEQGWDIIPEYIGDIKYSESVLSAKAELGDAEAQFNMYQIKGKDRSNYYEAIGFLTRAAQNGYTRAQAELGWELIIGKKINKDVLKGIEWLKKAIENNSADAYYYFALSYRSGIGVQKDAEQVIYNLQKAAELGHIEAQYDLSFCYLIGDKINKNENIAIELYKKASINDTNSTLTVNSYKEINEYRNIDNINNSKEYHNYHKLISTCCEMIVKLGFNVKWNGACRVKDKHCYALINVKRKGEVADDLIYMSGFGSFPEAYIIDGQTFLFSCELRHIENNSIEKDKLEEYDILLDLTLEE